MIPFEKYDAIESQIQIFEASKWQCFVYHMTTKEFKRNSKLIPEKHKTAYVLTLRLSKCQNTTMSLKLSISRRISFRVF